MSCRKMSSSSAPDTSCGIKHVSLPRNRTANFPTMLLPCCNVSISILAPLDTKLFVLVRLLESWPLLLPLRILCTAAARKEAFIYSLYEIGLRPLSVVPTLCFQGPIHGSFVQHFVHKEEVNRVCFACTSLSPHCWARFFSEYFSFEHEHQHQSVIGCEQSNQA